MLLVDFLCWILSHEVKQELSMCMEDLCKNLFDTFFKEKNANMFNYDTDLYINKVR